MNRTTIANIFLIFMAMVTAVLYFIGVRFVPFIYVLGMSAGILASAIVFAPLQQSHD